MVDPPCWRSRSQNCASRTWRRSISASSVHVSQRFVDDVRPAYSWQYGGLASESLAGAWARSISSELTERGLSDERLAIDKLDTRGFMALQGQNIALVDSTDITVDAREIKTPEEVEIMIVNGAIGDAIMAEFEAAIRPGIRELELYAVLSDTLLRYHGEFLSTRLVASGSNTNPWMSEAHDKLVQPGDLVGVDTDAFGYEGYVIDISRTFLCGTRATEAQRDAYRVAHECVTGMAEIIRVGMSFEDFAHAAPRLPHRYKEQRDMAMAHQAGLEIEGPAIPYLEDLEEDPGGRAIMPQRELQENMVLCLEAYVGERHAPFGVKLEDQVLVTGDGAKLLCTYPFSDVLMA